MNLSKLKRKELLEKCESLGLTKYKSKTKNILIEMITEMLFCAEPINIKHDDKKLNVLDLFCGCGGMSKGLVDAGLNVIAGIDIWDKAINSYKKNFNHMAICEDLTKLPPEKFEQLYNTEHAQIDILVGGPPCFIAGTYVCVYGGYKKIEDVSFNDKLLTHNGNYKTIINLQRTVYNGLICNLQIDHHDKLIKCTQDHPFYVMNSKDKQPKWIPANKLTSNNYIGMVINDKSIIPVFNFGDFEIFLNKKEHWFTLGYFFNNGSDDLCVNQCCEVIPEWMHNSPHEFIEEFAKGFELIECRLMSYSLVLSLQRLFMKVNKIYEITKCFDKYKLICKSSGSSFIEKNYAWFKIKNIDMCKVSKVVVYNFEVDNDNSYVVENLIVHNCQGFSIAGRRDPKDPRNSLFMEFVKYLNYYNPKMFIMENVIGILSMKMNNNNKVIDIIMCELEVNYRCIITKLYASDFEVPQNRKRVIIIGFRNDLGIMPTEPIPVTNNNRIPVHSVLLPKDQVDKKYYLSERALIGLQNKKKQSEEKGYGFGAQFLDFDKPSYTIPARYWKDGYDALVKYNDSEVRRLTIQELKRIQSFPDDFFIEGSNKEIIMQIGNAVACKFAYHLGNYIKLKLDTI